MTAEEIIVAVLLPFLKSGAQRERASEAVAAALAEAGHLTDDIETVEVRDSKVGVETTTLGGLTITLDAAGNAVRVTSPYGLDVIS